ncbi:MAG: RraA family protein [Chloroflexi bacterium]|nr:RraA family protein [Chloroflexota bacterium]
MSDPLSEQQLAALRAWPSPAIANAIETFDVRSRNSGFMGPEIVCRFPELPPIVGYAATGKIRASIPPAQDAETVGREQWYAHIESLPEPRIIVLQDMDQPPVGSFWGEVNGNIHRALGAVGVITDGGVRDLDEVRALGFQFLAKELLVSHAYIHLVEVGGPVTVGGLTVNPGDLLHADQHGAIQIPHEIAREVAAAAQAVEDRERVIINYAKSEGFSSEGLINL